MKKIAIFASGSGTNAENITHYFKDKTDARISLILCDNPSAGVIDRAGRLGVECVVIERAEFRKGEAPLAVLKERQVTHIVLAGFLSLVHPSILRQYEGRIINVHPALLPAYGGKGMYGDNVHRAVIAAGEKKSGITLHLVDEEYDKGEILARFEVAVSEEDTPETLAEKIHRLEYKYFPMVIEEFLKM